MLNQAEADAALAAAKHPQLLNGGEEVLRAARHWDRCEILGVDTEFVRERTYRADLGLVQISDGKRAWLVDPLVEDTLAPVRRLLQNPGICKVLHSGSEDLEVLGHSVDAVPAPLVDTQIACALLGQPLQLAYHNAAKWLFGIEIEKDQTRSNWCRRPLLEKQLRYAALDVTFLPLMLRELQPRLEDLGRWSWLEEEVSRMQETARESEDPELAYFRIGGFGRLDDESLRVLQALARWRETTARERNRARGFVVSDAGLMQLARLKPARIQDLRDIGEVHPVVVSRYGESLLKIIARATAGDAVVERHDALSPKQRKQLRQMRQCVSRKAQELGVEPALLASRRELEKLLRAVAHGSPPPERFRGWRRDVITRELLEIVDSPA